MRLEIDVTDCHDAADVAEELLCKEFPRGVLKAAKDAARDEQRFHKFDNYSGDLERSIAGRRVSSTEVEMVAGMDYASYVAARGRMNLKGAKNAAKITIDENIERMNRQIGRL